MDYVQAGRGDPLPWGMLRTMAIVRSTEGRRSGGDLGVDSVGVSNRDLMQAIEDLGESLSEDLGIVRDEVKSLADRERDLSDRVVRVEERQTTSARVQTTLAAVASVLAAAVGVKFDR